MAEPVHQATPADAYLRALARAVPGRGRVRAGLLAEVAGGLADAVDRHVATGCAPVAAEQAAVDEFGPVGVLACECGREVLAASLRRLALLFGVYAPASMLVWRAIWAVLPSSGPGASAAEPADYARLADGVHLLSLVAGAGALLAALALRSRALPDCQVERVGFALVSWVVLCVVATQLGGVLLTAGAHGWSAPASSAVVDACGRAGVLTAAGAVAWAVALLGRLRRMRRLTR